MKNNENIQSKRKLNSLLDQEMISLYRPKIISFWDEWRELQIDKKQKIASDFRKIRECSDTKSYVSKTLELETSDFNKSNILRNVEIYENNPSDNGKLKTWIDNILRFPFNVIKPITNENIPQEFLQKAGLILDECIYGQSDIKNTLLQMAGKHK